MPKPKPKPRPVAIPTTNSYYDPYQQQYGTSSAGNYIHDYNTGNNVGSAMKPNGENYNDNATPEELHVVERVEMNIPGDTNTHTDMQREEPEGEEMDVCTDYVDAPAYPAQYTYPTNEAPMRNTNTNTTTTTTSQLPYPSNTTTTTDVGNDPARLTTALHKYSPNPNIIPTSVSNNIPVLPAAPQHPVHPAQFNTPTATAAVNTRYPPVNHRWPAEPAQQVCFQLCIYIVMYMLLSFISLNLYC